MVKFNIEITYSKLMALLILLVGLTTSIVLKDSAIIILSIPISGAVISGKQYIDKEKKKIKE